MLFAISDSESYLEIGRFLLARAQYEKALAAFEKVRELLPSYAGPVVLAELDELILAASTGMAKG